MLQILDTARPEAFLKELARRSPQHEQILMMIAQRLEHKAREKERVEGRYEGERDAMLAVC